MAFRRETTWAGIGEKVGGHFFLGGADIFEGSAFRLDGWPDASAREVSVNNLRAGPGLGGALCTSFFFAFDTPMLFAQPRSKKADWGINVSIPEEKLGFGKASLKIFSGLTKGTDMLKSLTAAHIDGLRTLASMFYTAIGDLPEGLQKSEFNTFKYFTVDLPVGGTGLEASMFLSWGELEVGGRMTFVPPV